MPLTPDPNPSEKQLEVLEHIVQHVCEKGYQPSKVEMAAHFGVTRNAIAARLVELERRGIVEIVDERAVRIRYVSFQANYDETKDGPDAPSPSRKKKRRPQ